jgi:low temperature requirement protein LtrA
MPLVDFRKSLFRVRDGEDASRVTEIELFFDLVFVFAVTQLSHRLLDHLTPIGALETLILFAAVWWLWVYTSWATNWLDPRRGLVRVMLVAMMFGTLLLSTSLLKAFDGGSIAYASIFAIAYVTMQLGRTLLIVWAPSGHNRGRVRNFLRISFYFILSAPLWVAGAIAADPAARMAWWVGALAIEYTGPWLFFWTPGLGKSSSADWDISGAHMAERCALFIIIALGEAIVVTGATFAKLTPDFATSAAFAISVFGSAVMWWIYFDTGADRAAETIEDEETDTGRLARTAYTYLHIPIVAGIVVTAVSDELMLAQPKDHADLAFVLVTCGGPMLFLIGNQLFKWLTSDVPMPPLSHFVGMLLLFGAGVEGLRSHWQPLSIGAAAAFALFATAVWEWFSLNGGWRRWTPWLGQRAVIALDESER